MTIFYSDMIFSCNVTPSPATTVEFLVKTLITLELLLFWLTQKHEVHLFQALRQIMEELVKCRQDLLSGTLTQVCITCKINFKTIVHIYVANECALSWFISNSNKFQFGFLHYISFSLLEFFHNVVPLSINKKLSCIHCCFIGPNG